MDWKIYRKHNNMYFELREKNREYSNKREAA